VFKVPASVQEISSYSEYNRKCEQDGCKGRLVKTGVRFGQETPSEPLHIGEVQAKKCDLALVFGSSMTVSPFNQLPILSKNMVIVSLHPTPYDVDSTIKFFCKCDIVMREIMAHYKLSPDPYVYIQHFTLEYEKHGDFEYNIFITGGFPNEPCTALKQVVISGHEIEQNNLSMNFSGSVKAREGDKLNVQFIFRDEYDMPPQNVIVAIEGVKGQFKSKLEKIYPV